MDSLCFDPTWSLRRQMIFGFTFLGVSTIVCFFIVAVVSVVELGNLAKDESSTALLNQIRGNIALSSTQAARVIERKFRTLESMASLMEQFLLDSDDGTSFMDIDGNNAYPLPDDYETYLDYRNDIPGVDAVITGSTVQASTFFFKGTCNPAGGSTFYTGCTAANNDMDSSTQDIADASVRLDRFLPTMYESNKVVDNLSLYFYNGGKGAARFYPGFAPIPFNGYNPVPCTAVPVAAPDTCNPNDFVEGRQYNPVQRPFFQTAAADRTVIHHVGPYRNAFLGPTWLLSLSKAVNKRGTNNLLGVAQVDLDVALLQAETGLLDLPFATASHTGLYAANAQGTVVADEQWDQESGAEDPATILGLDNGIDQALWDKLRQSGPQEVYEYRKGGRAWLVTSALIPADSAEPRYVVLISVDREESEAAVSELEDEVAASVSLMLILTVVLGAVVVACIVGNTVLMAHRMTEPLLWLGRVARSIAARGGDWDTSVDSADLSGGEKYTQFPDEVGRLCAEFSLLLKQLGSDGAAKTVARERSAVPANPHFVDPAAQGGGKRPFWEAGQG